MPRVSPAPIRGRFGAFSDIYYDPIRQEWWALSDRGPGGGLLDYGTRLQRFDIVVHPNTGSIKSFKIRETVRFRDRNGRLIAPTAGVMDPGAMNGLNPLLLNNNAATLGRSFDPEGLVIDPRTGHFLVADEYGPSVYEFNRQGRLVGEFEVPANLVPKPNGVATDYVAGRVGGSSGAGRQDNRGYEGLAITPDGKKLYAVLQAPLINEGPRTTGTRWTSRTTTAATAAGCGSSCSTTIRRAGPTSRASPSMPTDSSHKSHIVDRILDDGGTAVAGPRVDNASPTPDPPGPDPSQGRNIGLSAIIALNNHEFLVIERDNRGIGVDNPGGRGPVGGPIPALGVVGSKRVYKIDIDDATDISSIDLPDNGVLTGAGPGGTDIVPVEKDDSDVFIDFAANTLLPNGNQAEKWEGLSIGPRLNGGNYLILAGNDSDYSVTQSGAGTQFDVYVNFNGGSVTRDIDQPTLLNGAVVGPPPPDTRCCPACCTRTARRRRTWPATKRRDADD